MKLRNPKSMNLPEESPSSGAGIWPDGWFFELPCFEQAKAKGLQSIYEIARVHIVSTPGTLGDKGAWRIEGHRLSVDNIIQLARHSDHSLAKGHPMTIATMALIAEEWYGWNGNDPLLHDKIEAALCFTLLYPEVYFEQTIERNLHDEIFNSYRKHQSLSDDG